MIQTPNLIQFEPKLLVKKKRKPKLLVKYVIIIYSALRSAHEMFGDRIKAVPKAKFPAEPGGKNGRGV